MSNAIGSSRESNPSRRICHLRAIPLGHVADSIHVSINTKPSNALLVGRVLSTSLIQKYRRANVIKFGDQLHNIPWNPLMQQSQLHRYDNELTTVLTNHYINLPLRMLWWGCGPAKFQNKFCGPSTLTENVMLKPNAKPMHRLDIIDVLKKETIWLFAKMGIYRDNSCF